MKDPKMLMVIPKQVDLPKLHRLTQNQQKKRKPIFFHNKWDPLVIVMRGLGFFSINIDKNGKFERKLISPLGIYCTILITVFTINEAVLIKGELDIMQTTELAFDDCVLIFGFIVVQCLQFIQVAFLAEGKKIATFLNELVDYEEAFHGVTGRYMNRVSLIKNHFVALLINATVGIVMYFGGQEILRRMLIRNDIILEDTVWYFSLVFWPLKFVILMSTMVLWRAWNEILSHCSIELIKEIENCHWMAKKNLNQYIVLWRKLYVIHGQFGNAICFSYTGLFLILFFIMLLMVYISAAGILPGSFNTVLYPFLATLLISVQIERGCGTALKIGENFQNRLVALLTIEMNSCNEEISNFIKTICLTRPKMSLAGFFNFERSISISMYSSVITYFIIIVQFRRDYSNSSRQENCTYIPTY